MTAPHVTRRQFLALSVVGLGGAGLVYAGLGAGAPAASEVVATPSFIFRKEDSVAKRILVTYATHTGSTVDVAAAIGETLGARGFAADVVPMKDKPRLDGYQAIILGSAVNSGKWLPDAIQFVKANQRALSSVPVTLFSVHIANLGDDERSRQARLAYLDSVRPYVRPVTEVFFAGRFDSKAIGGLGGWLASKFLPSGDLRDWGKIRAWAENVAL